MSITKLTKTEQSATDRSRFVFIQCIVSYSPVQHEVADSFHRGAVWWISTTHHYCGVYAVHDDVYMELKN